MPVDAGRIQGRNSAGVTQKDNHVSGMAFLSAAQDRHAYKKEQNKGSHQSPLFNEHFRQPKREQRVRRIAGLTFRKQITIGDQLLLFEKGKWLNSR
jgi:hypothetical protein